MIDLPVLVEGGPVTIEPGLHGGIVPLAGSVDVVQPSHAYYAEIGAPLTGWTSGGEPAAFPSLVGTAHIFNIGLQLLDIDPSTTWTTYAQAYLLERGSSYYVPDNWPSPPAQPHPQGGTFPPGVDPSTLRFAYESGSTGICKALEDSGWFPLGNPPTWQCNTTSRQDSTMVTIGTFGSSTFDIGSCPLGETNFGGEVWLYVLYELVDWTRAAESGVTEPGARNCNPLLPTVVVTGEAPVSITAPWPYKSGAAQAMAAGGGHLQAGHAQAGGGAPQVDIQAG